MKEKYLIISRGKKLLIVLALFVVLLLLWVYWTNTHIETTYIDIKNQKVPSDFNGYKIAQISDLHNHQWREELTDKLISENPDIIVVTGDLIDSGNTDLDIAMDFINEALTIAPVYYVTGNHEAQVKEYSDLSKLMTDAGVHMMDDRCEIIRVGNSNINIVGVQDPDFVERSTMGNIQGSIVETKLGNLLNKELYNIVLCHRPELFDNYVELEADLVLTGHAHGGQIRIPFVGGLIAPNQGLLPKYTEGVFHTNSTDMVVSRGLGNSIISLRINNNPELVIITLGN